VIGSVFDCIMSVHNSKNKSKKHAKCGAISDDLKLRQRISLVWMKIIIIKEVFSLLQKMSVNFG